MPTIDQGEFYAVYGRDTAACSDFKLDGTKNKSPAFEIMAAIIAIFIVRCLNKG